MAALALLHFPPRNIGEVKVTWATPLWGGKDNCHNYQYGNAIKMANCYQGSFQCNFFYNKDYTGASTKLFYNGQCVGGAQQLKSFACYYYVQVVLGGGLENV
ncbi:hypothetical protein ISF_06734 [Cordyceps fumosorosea ARSEF 2679]|uniref:Uncharacterized protein n=1 Tax=Cordyceps fumosorosea (strain ARSEF 2679) TaxID=1081104 RepID=A0A162IHP2_CORFA|nr:hypothetical protein ISF_06734 [Cordyceps fumosorosea ARSEF 2679]OAA58195.1 hypothetical protein ISF_06734 [Cordyceps fumosorosea ARSEF 2679]